MQIARCARKNPRALRARSRKTLRATRAIPKQPKRYARDPEKTQALRARRRPPPNPAPPLTGPPVAGAQKVIEKSQKALPDGLSCLRIPGDARVILY